MNKQTLIWVLIVLFAVLIVVGLLFWVGKDNVQAPIVGDDKDEHGCIGSAGYSWCELKQKCLRIWEEPCKETEMNFTKEGNLTGEINNWSLVYEEPGKPALTKKLRFDNLSKCFIGCEEEICDSSKLTLGERVRVSGDFKNDLLIVADMVYVNKPVCNGDKQ